MTWEEDIKLLEDNGWEVECHSPFEIRTKDDSFASGEAAYIVLNNIKSETVERFREPDMNDSFYAGINRGITIACIITHRDIGEEFPSYSEYMKKFDNNEK